MKGRQQDIVNVYKRITAIIYQRLSPTFGQRTIAAIAKNVLARQSKPHPSLARLKVSDEGIDWTDYEAHLGEVSEEEIAASLEAFMDEFFEALSNLIGRLIMAKLFKEAEQAAKGGGEA
ncbi:MAG: hypothetical protein HYY30_06015 [Chloroflexi bacterium]|nr:hypothetical protein [Chloroflexota bacterium]